MSDSQIWRIVDIPPVVSSTEGNDVTIAAKLDGPAGVTPTVIWIKGKFSELKKSARIKIGVDEEKLEAYLTIKKAKIFDDGKYTLKVITGKQEVQTAVQLNVGKQEITKTATGSAGGDADSFKKRMRRLQKTANKAIAGDQGDVWAELTKASPKDYAEIAFNHGITDLRGMLKRLAAVKKKKKDGEKDDKEKLNSNDLQHPVLKKARRRGTLTGDDMSQLPYDIKLKCGKAKKGQDNAAALDFRSLLKHVGAFSKKMAHSLSFTVGDRIILEIETSNEVTKGEWQKGGKKVCENNRIKLLNQGCKRRLIIDSCILSDDANFSYVCGTERSDCEVFVRDLPCTIITPLEDTQMIVGQQVIMTARLSVAGAKVKLFHEGVEVKMSAGVTYLVKEKLFEFRIDKLKYDHAGFYQLKTNGDECLAELIVEDKPIDFNAGFSDLTVNCTDYAEFKCEVNDPEIEGRWYKDGIPIIESERIKFVNDGCLRKICIFDVRTSDIGEYEYRCKSGKTELSMTACLDAIELQVEKPKEPPKIYLNLNENREICVRAGCKLAVDVPITRDIRGKDEQVGAATNKIETHVGKRIQGGMVYIDDENAEIIWTRQLRGDIDGDGKVDLNEYLEPEVISEDGKHVHSDNIPDKTSMILHDAVRGDAGRYQLEVRTETGVDKIHFLVRIIDVPGPPTQPRISELVGESCRVDWGPPLEDGGCLIRGYLIERKKTCSTRWIRLNSSLHEFHNFFADRMMEGSEYEIRISAVNECGIGEPSPNSAKFVPMEPTSEVLDFCSSDVTDGTIKLNWMPPLDIGYAGLDGYELQHQVLQGKKHDDDAISATRWVDSNKEKLLHPDAMDFICKNLEVGKYYAFRIRTRNIAGSSKWVYCGPIICAFAVVDAKLLIPKEYKNPGIIVRNGDHLNVLIPFEGRPLPQISWSMLEPPKPGWEFLEATMRPLDDYVNIKNTQHSSQMTIKEASMRDTGKYFIKLAVGDVEVEGEISVNVVDIPGAVEELKIVEIVGTTAELSWKPPVTSGNLEIIGYRVEKRDKRSGNDCPWFMCLEKTRHEKCFIHGLVPNNQYAFRVTAINEIGHGPPSTTDYARVEKTPYELKLKPFISKATEKAPKFTTPLNSRSMIVNYETTLSCSFEAYPPPRITWLLNKVPIDKMNPHYMMISHGGICQLKLRRVRYGDGGIYSCLAENDLGSDQVTTKVDVQDPEAKLIKVL